MKSLQRSGSTPRNSKASNTSPTPSLTSSKAVSAICDLAREPTVGRTVSTKDSKAPATGKQASTTTGSHVSGISNAPVNRKPPSNFFQSRRKHRDVPRETPWLEKKDPREKWQTIFPLMGALLGLLIIAILIWFGMYTISHLKYCPVLNENFTSTWNESVWAKEVEVGGFGTGQFQETTNTDENVYTKDGILYIKPTLQDPNLMERDNVRDLRNKSCTGIAWSDCVATTNTTNGTIINPVKSARINTKMGASIKFGRVEVEAKLPAGDWLWPSIEMLPKDNFYGPWPRSGAIDIMHARGNNKSYPQGGFDIVSSALHFGPDAQHDGWWRNIVKQRAMHSTYAKKYHIFGIEWNERYIFTYIDTRLLQVLYTQFARSFWDYGQFPFSNENGTRLINPWLDADNKAAPFDKDFYLVLTVGVGGTNGWFEDGKSGKPWMDHSQTAMREFWQARDSWYSSWEKGGWMEVKSVKMWQQEGYCGCGKGKG